LPFSPGFKMPPNICFQIIFDSSEGSVRQTFRLLLML